MGVWEVNSWLSSYTHLSKNCSPTCFAGSWLRGTPRRTQSRERPPQFKTRVSQPHERRDDTKRRRHGSGTAAATTDDDDQTTTTDDNDTTARRERHDGGAGKRSSLRAGRPARLRIPKQPPKTSQYPSQSLPIEKPTPHSPHPPFASSSAHRGLHPRPTGPTEVPPRGPQEGQDTSWARCASTRWGRPGTVQRTPSALELDSICFSARVSL